MSERESSSLSLFFPHLLQSSGILDFSNLLFYSVENWWLLAADSDNRADYIDCESGYTHCGRQKWIAQRIEIIIYFDCTLYLFVRAAAAAALNEWDEIQ